MKARLPKGVGGGPTNMQGMIKQAQKMQEDMTALQAELDTREYEVKAGGGVVTVKINGKLEVLSIDIAPEVVDPDDIETMTDIVIAAVNEAIKKVNETNSEEMGKITGGLNVPGLPGLF
ncbi:MAG: YbaB/EbfC family nucleoid-associated protein [Clostridia bacterium]|nr:YbaB/EbfC family nucleoid-associated protein [Clostridia bacterium]MBQ8369304.1 YbaB/EbfC family nucleoid-associated protein [Clostridia bacterium]MBQ8511980.1 YbaB/EbfC family nucleoid-associated protein [Clostridia bacterium]